MLHGAVIRTFAQSDVETFARGSGLPTVNALTDAEHPCQILADLFTIQEKLGDWRGKTVCYLGDGACNVPTRGCGRRRGWGISGSSSPRRRNTSRRPDLLARLGPGAHVRCEEDPRGGGARGGRACTPTSG